MGNTSVSTTSKEAVPSSKPFHPLVNSQPDLVESRDETCANPTDFVLSLVSCKSVTVLVRRHTSQIRDSSSFYQYSPSLCILRRWQALCPRSKWLERKRAEEGRAEILSGLHHVARSPCRGAENEPN